MLYSDYEFQNMPVLRQGAEYDEECEGLRSRIFIDVFDMREDVDFLISFWPEDKREPVQFSASFEHVMDEIEETIEGVYGEPINCDIYVTMNKKLLNSQTC